MTKLITFRRRSTIIGLFAIACYFGGDVYGDENKGSLGGKKPELSEEQKGFNKEFGSDVVQTTDSTIATKNINLKNSVSINYKADAEAEKLVKDLSEEKSLESAKGIIDKLFSSEASSSVKRKGRKAALSRLATLADREGRLEESQQYLAEYVKRYPNDQLIPVVLLRQGDLYRKMGAYDLERQKYYDVIKAAPRVKLDKDQFDLQYVKRVVLIARSQIAESFFDEGKRKPLESAEESYSNSVEMFRKLKGESALF